MYISKPYFDKYNARNCSRSNSGISRDKINEELDSDLSTNLEIIVTIQHI